MNTAKFLHGEFYSASFVLMLSMALVANGCIPVFVPTPPHGVRTITQETVEPLKPGQSTQTDVLHLLGDPTERIENDRFFVYGWSTTWGYTGWGGWFPFTLVAPGGAEKFNPIVDRRGLIIEFTPDNGFRRLQFIKYDDWNDIYERWKKEED